MGLAYTKGELVDRFSIELRKRNYGANNLGKLLTLSAAIGEETWTADDVRAAIECALANADIALLESVIRQGGHLSDHEIGRRARVIRKINERRVGARNVIDKQDERFVPAYEGIDAKELTKEDGDLSAVGVPRNPPSGVDAGRNDKESTHQ